MGKDVKKDAEHSKKPNKKQTRIQDFKKKKLEAAMDLVGGDQSESDQESSVDSEEAAMAENDNKRKTGK